MKTLKTMARKEPRAICHTLWPGKDFSNKNFWGKFKCSNVRCSVEKEMTAGRLNRDLNDFFDLSHCLAVF